MGLELENEHMKLLIIIFFFGLLFSYVSPIFFMENIPGFKNLIKNYENLFNFIIRILFLISWYYVFWYQKYTMDYTAAFCSSVFLTFMVFIFEYGIKNSQTKIYPAKKKI